MIEINEKFTVAAPPDEVYAVLSDPNAVVECVAGAALGDKHDDGTFEGTMTVKFSALRVMFKGRVGLELNEADRGGSVRATGRDGQGGTKFQALAAFHVEPRDGGATSEVTATGEVELSGKLASVIEGAATAVVRRMTGEFVEALSVRCASGAAQLGPAQPEAAPGRPAPTAGVLLLHDFGGSPNSLRAWGEALAEAGLAVRIPRLPGHGTRWQDLNRTTWPDWYEAADAELTALRADHDPVYVMGLSLGALLALRLVQRRPGDVAGLVLVNPLASGLRGTPSWLRLFRRSVRAVTGDVKIPGASDVGYARVPLRAAASVRQLGATVRADLGAVTTPVLVGTSTVDHVVEPEQGEAIWQGLTAATPRERVRFPDSFHVVPLDNDARELFDRSIAFVRAQALVSGA
jgi:carboxylesterase